MIEMAYATDSGVLTLNLGKIDRNIRPLDASTVNSPNLPNIEIPPRLKSPASLAQALRAASRLAIWSTSASMPTHLRFTYRVKPTR